MRKKMSCGVDEYKRIKAIDDLFKLGYKYTVKELSVYLKLKNLHDPANAFSCGVSEKVLYKVLTAMKNELHVPLTKGYLSTTFVTLTQKFSSGITISP